MARSVRNAQLIATKRAHDILVVDVEGLGSRLQQADRSLGIYRQRAGLDQSRGPQERVVPGGNLTALEVPTVNVLQFDAQHCRLQRVEAAVPADLLMVVALTATMVAQPPDMVRQNLVI